MLPTLTPLFPQFLLITLLTLLTTVLLPQLTILSQNLSPMLSTTHTTALRIVQTNPYYSKNSWNVLLMYLIYLSNLAFWLLYNNANNYTTQLTLYTVQPLTTPLPLSLLNIHFHQPYNWIISLVVMLVSSIVLLNSIDYLSNQESHSFLTLIILFNLTMLIFVLHTSLLLIMLCWDWLGLVSYLLINWWSGNPQHGINAVLYNNVGDCSFLLLLCLFYTLHPSTQSSSALPLLVSIQLTILYLSSILSVYGVYNYHFIYLLSLSLLLIIYTNSAQLPFSSWLINAMSAPTPISALLHSSTMVIAGVYVNLNLLSIMNLLLSSLRFLEYPIVLVPILTLYWSLLNALSLNDIKSLIAFSTVSQLSYLFISLIQNLPYLTVYHIYVHAFFNSLLFLLSGTLIHLYNNFQLSYNLQLSSNNLNILFLISSSMLILSLSNESIILYSLQLINSNYLFFVLLLGSLLTTLYTMNLLYLSFHLSNSFLSQKSTHNFVIFALFYILYILQSFYNQPSTYFAFLPSTQHFYLSILFTLFLGLLILLLLPSNLLLSQPIFNQNVYNFNHPLTLLLPTISQLYFSFPIFFLEISSGLWLNYNLLNFNNLLIIGMFVLLILF